MPFLKSLQNSGHNCLNMYSQGPYTEAALTPFYTGRDNMDFGGNFFREQQTNKVIAAVVAENIFNAISKKFKPIFTTAPQLLINNNSFSKIKSMFMRNKK